jgi:predicted ATPase
VRQFRREWTLLLGAADEAIAISRKYGQLDSLNWAQRQRAVALCELGRWEEGLPALREGLAAQVQSGSPVGLPMDYCHEASCCISLGRLEEARSALDRAFAIVRGTGVRAWEPELLRTEGLWLLARDGRAIDAARECFEQALQLAQSRQALMLQLRAAMSLARLWESQGHPRQALDTLQPVYAAFTEGHEVRDLVEAGDVLDRLSSARGG